MYKIVLLRHGQSVWNQQNRFTGWRDVGLSEQGQKEAKSAGQILKIKGYDFDVAYTSFLKRAIKTLWYVLEETDLMWIDVHRSWRLNERHYGALQGLNKDEMAEKHGKEQVHLWRRSYNELPPLLEVEDKTHPCHDRRYKNLEMIKKTPMGESLELTIKRFLPLWESSIAEDIKKGRRVLIAAHGNSLRALVQHLEQKSEEDIMSVNIPTGNPLVYELNKKLEPINSYYLESHHE